MADLTWVTGTFTTVSVPTECFNRATAAKARFFGLTNTNRCYIGDSQAYSSKGLQPAFQCMYNGAGVLGKEPAFGDVNSLAMYEISYSRTVPVIDAVTVGQSVRPCTLVFRSLTR